MVGSIVDGLGAAHAAWVAAALVAAGCGQTGRVPTYHRDIEPIVRARCAPCHNGTGVAPGSLVSFEEVHARRELVRAVVVRRTMPPWGASRACAEYQGAWSLTDEQIAAIARWVSEGAASGEVVPGDSALETPVVPGLSRVDLVLTMPVPYLPTRAPSDYRCFLAEWPERTTKYVTGFRARPGNAALVHHAIAYAVPPEQRAVFQALDDADPGPGYDCPAGPGFIDRRVSWIGAWEPGGMGEEYPVGTGFAVAPGSALVIQMHYDTERGASGSDRTTFELRLEERVEREARVMPWADPAWITTDAGMFIRAGESDVVHSYFADPTPLMFDGEPLSIRGVSVHMHQLGIRGTLSILRANGTCECLLDVPRWDFSWQRSYLLTRARPLYPGDRLGIECHWDNSADNQPIRDDRRQPPRDLSWGGGTSDEMCLGAAFVTRL